MNIAIDIRSLMEPNRSGVAEYAYNLLEHLLKIDSKNQYFLFYNSYSDISKNLPAWNRPNVRFVAFKYPNKLFNLSIKFLKYPKLDGLINESGEAIAYFLQNNSKIDLFFIPNLNFIALRSACKRIITVHDLSFERHPEFYSLKRRLWHKIINPKKLITSADGIMAVSQNTKNDLIAIYKIPAEKIKVIYSGVGNEYKPITDQAQLNRIKQKYLLPDNFILYLGNLEPRKNIEGLIEAYQSLATSHHISVGGIKLVIAGAKSWGYEPILKLVHEHNDNVKYIDYVASEDKPALYNLAKLFVYPSFYEGFGFPPLEAMASGTPVITGLSSSQGEIVDRAGLLVDPYNINEMAAAMAQILTDENLRNNLIKKGLEQAKKFNWTKTAEETLEYINNI